MFVAQSSFYLFCFSGICDCHGALLHCDRHVGFSLTEFWLIPSYGAITWGFTWDNKFLHGDSVIDIGKCFGLLSFGLAVNCLVPSSYVSMEHKERVSPIISWSIIFALSLYVLMGMAGLLTFNKVDINAFIFVNIPSNSPFFYISSGVLSAMLILITPIIVYPSSLTIDAWLTSKL